MGDLKKSKFPSEINGPLARMYNAPLEIILQTCQNECTIMHLLTMVSALMEPKLLTYSLHSTSVATPVKMQELLGA